LISGIFPFRLQFENSTLPAQVGIEFHLTEIIEFSPDQSFNLTLQQVA